MIDLSSLLLITDGDEALLNALLTEFIRTTDSDLSALQSAVEHQDSESVAQLAHRIKGAASIIGATQLVKLVDTLENAGRNRELEQLIPLLSETEDCYKNISTEISHYK